MRRIRYSERLHADLELDLLSNLKITEDAHVQIEEAWPTDYIAPCGSEAYLSPRNCPERARVEIMARHVGRSAVYCGHATCLDMTLVAQDANRADLISSLNVSGRINLGSFAYLPAAAGARARTPLPQKTLLKYRHFVVIHNYISRFMEMSTSIPILTNWINLK